MFKSHQVFRILMICAILALTTSACGTKPAGSSLDSVDVDQTDVRNQYSVGFCWAYATIGFIESKYKMQTGESLDLSEEAIGFYRMADELLRVGQAARSGRVTVSQAAAKLQDPDALEGWYVRSSPGSRDGMELVDLYGAVPEADWSFKFTSSDQMKNLKSSVASAYRALLTSQRPITMESIAEVLTSPGGFPSVPPKTVRFKGQTLAATDFAKNTLGFRSSDYTNLSARSAADTTRIVSAMKRALARGLSVPIGFVLDFDRLNNGAFKAPNYPLSQVALDPSLMNGVIGPRIGGHAVLISDFVNKGGREGSLSSAELKSEVAKHVEELEYIKFKNSWGLSARQNESGIPVTSGSQGYYYMDLGYLKAAAHKSFLSIVVPNDLARNPEETIVINPSVTNGR